jgi:hypothetical protein
MRGAARGSAIRGGAFNLLYDAFCLSTYHRCNHSK